MAHRLKSLLVACSAFYAACSPGASASGTGIDGSAVGGSSTAQFSSTSAITQPPETAIVAGSFTVWAVPPNPAPLQSYVINVQVKVPTNAVNYGLRDLSGYIEGSDGFEKSIGIDSIDQTFDYNNLGSALLKSTVPGGRSGIQDAISVQSALLKEKQTVHLTFTAKPSASK